MATSNTFRGSAATLRDGFLREAIAEACVYRRAAAFFSSSTFQVAPNEFADFFKRGGRMELVCCPQLSRQDIEALISALNDRRKWFSYSIPSTIRNATDARNVMAWAVATGHLHILIALVPHKETKAIYHEKLGLIETQNNEILGFSGSANESMTAYVHNFERIQVYRSSIDSDREMLQRLREDFEALWMNTTSGLNVVPLHEALATGLVHPREPEDGAEREDKARATPGTTRERHIYETLIWPARLQLRVHQEDAIERWFQAGGKGIYAMATGAGKTIAAMGTAVRLFERVGGPLIIIVVAPFLSLVDQWIEVMRGFGLRPIKCALSSAVWRPQARSAVLLANQGKRPVVSLVTTNATFMGDSYQRVLEQLNVRTLLIADEVHNLGAQRLRQSLPEQVVLRLGLSATHERKWDEEGTQALQNYFGSPVISFGLHDAMQASPSPLCPYAYHPVLVELDEDEHEEYTRLTRSIGRLLGGHVSDDPSDVALGLLLKRARLLASARGKLPALRRAMAPYTNTSFNLVYCGDGQTDPSGLEPGASLDSSNDERLIRQLDAVVRLLGREMGMRVASYTADTSPERRVQLLEEFREGHLQALVAIRCLDEGVDIPQVRRAFILASSTNPRQFIQRRGRVLRRAPDKDKADIYDFFVFPPLENLDKTSASTERGLVAREMERALDFLALAINATEARHKLLPVLKTLHLLDMLMGGTQHNAGTRLEDD